MKIALVNENSQAPKNQLIFETLRKVAEPMGHSCYNYGRFSAEDPHQRTYVQAGIMTALLINSKAADFVITGCGTGEGAMLACNSFPNVTCGYAKDPIDAYLFSQINNGNALSMPYALGFGWGGELNLLHVFEKLLCNQPGGGYPPELEEVERKNKVILDQVKKVTHTDFLTVLKTIDQDLLKGTIAEESFSEMFFAHCQVKEIGEYVQQVLNR